MDPLTSVLETLEEDAPIFDELAHELYIAAMQVEYVRYRLENQQ